MVQYHPTPSPSKEEKHSGVVEADVSPPKETKGKTKSFPSQFLRVKPVVTRQSWMKAFRATMKL